MIKTEFDYSEEALKAFFKFQLLIKEKTKWIFYGTSTIFVLLGLILIFLFRLSGLGLMSIILAIILVLIFPVLVNKAVNKQVKSKYKRDPQTITFYEEKITQNIDGNIKEYNWLDIIEVNETKQYIYLYITEVSALIVDKTKLEQQTLRELIDMIRKCVGGITLYKNR